MSQNNGLPKPFVVPNSGQWLGSDGAWSTFYVYAGTPAQNFHVLPNFNGQALYVPIDADCARLNITNCGSQRGVEIFNSLQSLGFQPNSSSSWKELGNYKLGLGENLGVTGTARYGYDTFGPGISRPNDGIKLENTTVVAYVSPDVWLGQLGLSMFPIIINETERPHSLLARMKEGGHISSLSFGYQAGAPYRFTKVPGNLVLGGYDRSLQGNKTLTFTSIQDIVVGLQSISAQFSNGTTSSLSTSGIQATITTNAAEIWLPRAACDVFATAFNLTYFPAADRYILNDSARADLQRSNPTISFQIGTSTSGGDTISIALPYAAFDLQARYPIFGEQTNYFPLRRAANESQYALGRVFLQEAYLSVDWERELFNISQAAFNSPRLPADIITIQPVNSSSILVPRPGQSSGKALSSGAIAGIVIGAVIFILALAAGAWWFFRKRKRQAKADETTPQEGPVDHKKYAGEYAPEAVEHKPPVHQVTNLELEGSVIQEMYAPHGKEGQAHHATGPHDHIAEADGSSPIFELPSPHQYTPGLAR